VLRFKKRCAFCITLMLQPIHLEARHQNSACGCVKIRSTLVNERKIEVTAVEQVAFVIPTYNEARSIGLVIDRIPVSDLQAEGFESCIYVVDGRSVDDTIDIATKKGAQIIVEKRKGKGVALQTAFKSISADYVIVSDGDDTYPLDVAPEMVSLLQTYDVVIGSRLGGSIEPGAMTQLNVVGNTLLTILGQLLFKARVSDMCTGLWGYQSEAMRRLELSAQGFEIEADMFAECVLKGFTIAELPINYYKRTDQAKLSSIKDGLKIGLFLFQKRFIQANGRKIR
jgi:glycosyltransferase involved in cell wall biosynthesis